MCLLDILIIKQSKLVKRKYRLEEKSNYDVHSFD
jgi:hypothetical protein